jgi:hypothetical protein
MTWLALIPLLALVAWLFLTPLDAWIERHTTWIEEGYEFPDQQIAYVRVKPSRYAPGIDLRYFFARLPSFSWELNLPRDEYAWHQLVCCWSSHRGWFTYWHRVPV